MNIEDIMPPDWQSWNYTLGNFAPNKVLHFQAVNFYI